MTITFTTAASVPDDVDVVGVPVFAGRVAPDGTPPELDQALDTRFLEAQGFEGKVDEVAVLPGPGGSRIVAIGVGEPDAVTVDVLRRAAAAFSRAASGSASSSVSAATTLPSLATAAAPAPPHGPAQAPPHGSAQAPTQAVVEGMGLAAYRFSRHKAAEPPAGLERVVLVGGDEAAIARGTAVVEAVALARDLVNEPPGSMTPTRMAEAAVEVAGRVGLVVRVLDEVAIEGEGLGGLRGVSLGSDEPPRLVELVYDPGQAVATVAVVGKGITFDSGGLSIKTAEGMMTMKTDMSGAAAVIGMMSALPALAPAVRVIGIMPCTENMPGGRAIKPGDVLKTRNGTTVEVLNTDAEGRLVLADGLALAVERDPDAIVDLATLTGAVVAALGRKVAGLMGTDDGLVDRVRAAADRAGEQVWHLPLPQQYRKDLDSDVADLKNIGVPGQAGTLVAGLFLKEFVGDVPWAHLDIAGTARAESDDGVVTKGGTGFGVRTLLELVAGFSDAGSSGVGSSGVGSGADGAGQVPSG